MRRGFYIAATGLVLALVLPTAPAHAQAVRTFVSGHGTDSGTCGVGSPCRTFAFALTQTNAGGEIAVLDTAGYGILTINHAVSITNEAGVEAAITVASADGVTIAAGATDIVNLTGLTLTGGGGNNGIRFNSGGTLNIKNCVVRGFTGNGINLLPTASSNFTVTDTIVSNNATDGILVQPIGTGTTTARFERVQATGSEVGFEVYGGSATGTLKATATNSDASGNTTGFAVGSFTGQAATTFTVANSTAANNSIDGLQTSSVNATMFVAGTTVSGNAGFGFSVGPSSVMNSFGNTNITDTTNSGTLTKVSQQ
jgi:hypothetical protein